MLMIDVDVNDDSDYDAGDRLRIGRYGIHNLGRKKLD